MSTHSYGQKHCMGLWKLPQWHRGSQLWVVDDFGNLVPLGVKGRQILITTALSQPV